MSLKNNVRLRESARSLKINTDIVRIYYYERSPSAPPVPDKDWKVKPCTWEPNRGYNLGDGRQEKISLHDIKEGEFQYE